MTAFVKVFGCRPLTEGWRAHGRPASENLDICDMYARARVMGVLPRNRGKAQYLRDRKPTPSLCFCDPGATRLRPAIFRTRKPMKYTIGKSAGWQSQAVTLR